MNKAKEQIKLHLASSITIMKGTKVLNHVIKQGIAYSYYEVLFSNLDKRKANSSKIYAKYQ
jgi:hypothetical protein